jgi:gliding motility-associated-like protein
MKKQLLFFFIVLNFCVGAQPLQEYFFNNNFNGTAGGGPLTEVLTCGAGLGSFGTQTITTSAGFCSNSTAFCFNDGGGLSYPNNSITSQYTINLFCKFNALSGYTRIIDFSNGASDNGIYLLNNCLNLFPNGTIGPCPYFNPNLYYLFTFVRDGATNTISVYVNGTFFSSYLDATNMYRPATITTPIIFFRDDLTVPCEAAPGCIRYASVSSGTLSAAQVNTVWVNICNTITTCTVTVSPSTTVCAGATTTLTAGSAVSYTWSPAAGLSSVNGASVAASPTATTIYTVTGTDAASCVNSATVQVTVSSNPVLAVSPHVTVCPTSSATLTAAGVVSYTWSPAASLNTTNGTSVIATPASTTVYTVTGTNAAGCIGASTIQVAVSSNPLITVSPNASVCPAGSTTLTAAGAVSYTWAPAASLSSANGATVTATPATTTIYTVTGANATGCTGTNTVQVSLNANPVLSGSPNATICASTSTTLNAAGAVSYTWSPAGSLSSANGATVTATPATSTTYTITGTNASGCVGTYTISVSVINNPTITAVGGTLCTSSSATLTASGATSYTWSPAASLSSANGASVIATPPVTTTYTITGLSGICTGSAIATASVVAVAPVITASSNTYCIGGTGVTLIGTGASTYSWSPAFGLSATSGATVSASPTVTTTYTLIGTTGACSGSQTISITVAPVASLSIVSSGTLICPNGSGTTLTASGGSTYTWSPGFQTTPTLTVNPLTTTTYTVAGQSAAGCATFPAVITVSVSPAINTTLTASSPSVCLTKTVSISVMPVGGVYTYTWLPASAIQGSNAGSSIIAKPSTTATVIYTVSISNGVCRETNTISLQVFDCVPPVSSFTTLTNDSICTKACVSFTATSTGIQPFTYQWLFPGGTPPTSNNPDPIVCYSSSGSYAVSLITGNAFGNDTLLLNNYISVADTPSVRAFGDTLLSIGQTAPISVTGNATSYYWSPDNGSIACVTCTNTVAQPTVTTKYMVTAYNSPYCKRRDSVLVKVDFTCGDFFIPNVFSPNGDGLNDDINIHGFCIATFNLKIFNRWGEKIFETTDKTLGWDGTFRGKALDTGVFIYAVDGITIERKPFTKKGNITLLR